MSLKEVLAVAAGRDEMMCNWTGLPSLPGSN